MTTGVVMVIFVFLDSNTPASEVYGVLLYVAGKNLAISVLALAVRTLLTEPEYFTNALNNPSLITNLRKFYLRHTDVVRKYIPISAMIDSDFV